MHAKRHVPPGCAHALQETSWEQRKALQQRTHRGEEEGEGPGEHSEEMSAPMNKAQDEGMMGRMPQAAEPASPGHISAGLNVMPEGGSPTRRK